MKFYQLLLIALSLSLYACGGSEGSLKKEIKQLEKKVAESSDVNDAVTLISKYHSFIEQNPDQTEQNATYLGKSADLYLKMNKPLQAVNEIETAIREQYTASNIPDLTLKMADIYSNKLRDNATANAVYKAYTDLYTEHEAYDSINALVGQVVDLDVQMKGMMNNIFEEEEQRINRKMANRYIKLAEIKAMFYPDDEASIDALHQAGETARTIQNYRKAIAIYDWIQTAYPDHPKTAQAMFLQGFTYDNNLKDTEKAREIYQSFLEKYPEDDFADDTRFLLENLGKSDDEIIQKFEQGKEEI